MGTTKNIAILTGATGGLGYAFLKELCGENISEIWAVGRNEQRLLDLKEEFGEIIYPICVDLMNNEGVAFIGKLLEEKAPRVKYLINNAGVAKMEQSKNFTVREIENTIDLNCKVPTVLINVCMPYMAAGSKIINVSSASAFQPVPYLNLYASTKVYLCSYSRALNAELKPADITVTAVCPGWIDTDMLQKEINGKKVNFYGLVSPDKVAIKAMRDAKKGKDMSICGLYVKCQHFNVKLLPQKFTMKIWLKNIKKYFN